MHGMYDVNHSSYNSVTGVEEITPEQSSLSLTTSLKLFITQMHGRGFGLIGPRQVHVEYEMHTCVTIRDVKRTHAIQTLHVEFGGRLDGLGYFNHILVSCTVCV